MELKINLDGLKKLNLTPNQFTYLYLIYRNKLDKFPNVCQHTELEELEDRGYIKIMEFDAALREPGYALFEVRDDIFEQRWLEFKANYPVKQDSRRLHDQPDACKLKYKALAIEHEDILIGLSNELDARRQAGLKGEFFPNQKTMSAYLKQKHWKTYIDWTPDENQERFKTV